MMSEAERIRNAYARRDAQGKAALYTLLDPAALYAQHRREEAILAALRREGTTSLGELRILDLGCGTGSVLRDFVRYGAQPGNCFGLDLLPDRIERARVLSPNMTFTCANAEALPYGDASFDIVLCFTVFTSILDAGMKRRLADEMYRVLRPGGFILWYDYHMDNPRNPDVRGVGRKEIGELFARCRIDLRRVTLAPPLARLLAPWSTIACMAIEKLPLLRTHYLGVFGKDSA